MICNGYSVHEFVKYNLPNFCTSVKFCFDSADKRLNSMVTVIGETNNLIGLDIKPEA